MKKQGNRKATRKHLKPKKMKNKTKNVPKTSKTKQKRKIIRKGKKRTIKKYNKKVMKGGAIPFSELNPSTVIDHAMHGVKGMLSGSLVDNAQHVPNNLPHNVNPSVMNQPHLDGRNDGVLSVAGDSPDVHFASS